MGPLNPALGTHGFPDCVQPGAIPADIDEAQMTMVCAQRSPAVAAGAPQPLKIACVGDSITAGAHASNASMGYPGQLQRMLDPAKYAVTNLGACGSTMQKNGDSPCVLRGAGRRRRRDGGAARVRTSAAAGAQPLPRPRTPRPRRPPRSPATGSARSSRR
jgi:hypothetical protein